MDSSHDKKRVNVEGDRLSNLPDDLIHKILSFIDIKHAIETSALSSRWRYIWTSMPCLNFSTKDFHTFAKFSKFVTHVLSCRKNQIEVSSVNLSFHGKVSRAFAKRILSIIMNYEFSHNVQQLNITCSRGKQIESPLSLFSSQSLKHLTLTGCTYEHPIMTTPTWVLPTLTTLYLHRVTCYVHNTTDKHAGLFSNFANLKNLTLKECIMKGLNGFNICHPRLSNLTLDYGYEGGNLVTPQLKNLTIRQWSGMLMISAPDLASLHYKGHVYPLQLSAALHLEKLRSVKFLTLNLEIIKLLSTSVELISHQPSPFANLKSLKIYPNYATLEERTQANVTICTEVKNYLLNGSPDASFTVVSHEEIRAVMNVALARNLMRELQVQLDRWKENSETNTAHMKQEKAPMESHMATIHEQVEVEDHRAQPDTIIKPQFRERMTHINEQFRKGYKNTDRAISMLRTIEAVLTRLPTSHRAKLQVRFSSLCAEAETIMDIMVDDLKIQCDKKPRLFREPATASLPSP